MYRNWTAPFFGSRTLSRNGPLPRSARFMAIGSQECKLLGIEGEGGIIGEMAVIDAGIRSATATARSKVELACLDQDQFRKLVRENSKFSLHAMTIFANRLRSVDAYISTRLEP